MTDRGRLERFLRSTMRTAGEQYREVRGQVTEAKEVYRVARNASELPEDEEGRAKIVCRRYAERRAVRLDDRYRPACYEAEHPDCEGCVEDVHEGRIEVWR